MLAPCLTSVVLPLIARRLAITIGIKDFRFATILPAGRPESITVVDTSCLA